MATIHQNLADALLRQINDRVVVNIRRLDVEVDLSTEELLLKVWRRDGGVMTHRENPMFFPSDEFTAKIMLFCG